MKIVRRGALWAAASTLVLTACSSGGSDSPFGVERSGESEGGAGSEGGTGSAAELTGAELAERAVETLADADALRIATAEGTSIDGATLDLHLDRAGACTGAIGMEGTGSFEILKRGDEVWLKPDEGFLRMSLAQELPDATESETEQIIDAAVAALDGRYLHGSAADDAAFMDEMDEFCSLDSLLEDMEPGEETEEEPVTREDATLDGEPVVRLETVDESGDRLVLVVAAEGEPYPLQLIGDMDGVRGKLVFSEFDEPVVFQEPTEAEAISSVEYQTLLFDELLNGGEIAG